MLRTSSPTSPARAKRPSPKISSAATWVDLSGKIRRFSSSATRAIGRARAICSAKQCLLQPNLRNFSGYLSSSGAQVPIYDPLTQCGQYTNPACGTSTVQRTAFPGNIIPASRINPTGANILAFPEYALPNTAGQAFTNNLNSTARNAATGGDNDQFNVRGDHQLSEKQRLLARYSRWRSNNLPVNVYGNGLLSGDPFSPEAFVTTNAVLADTYVLSPTVIFDIRGGFLRWWYTRIPGTLGTDKSVNPCCGRTTRSADSPTLTSGLRTLDANNNRRGCAVARSFEEMRGWARKEVIIDGDVNLFVVEGDHPGDRKKVASGKVVGPGQVRVGGITEADRPIAEWSVLIGAGRDGFARHEMVEVHFGPVQVVRASEGRSRTP